MDNYVISISREYGSGGRLIGKQLAARLGIPCYDRTIIQKTSEKSGLSPDFIARAEQRARSRFHMAFPSVAGISPAFTQHAVPVSQQAFFAQADVIRELAAQGPCVMVGRCSDYVLGDRPNCIKIFIHADMEDRIARCIQDYGVPEESVHTYISMMDRGRANYYNYYTGLTWGEMRRYDLTVNTSATGIEGAVELIARMVELQQEMATIK